MFLLLVFVGCTSATKERTTVCSTDKNVIPRNVITYYSKGDEIQEFTTRLIYTKYQMKLVLEEIELSNDELKEKIIEYFQLDFLPSTVVYEIEIDDESSIPIINVLVTFDVARLTEDELESLEIYTSLEKQIKSLKKDKLECEEK